jgi:hypothetical protein
VAGSASAVGGVGPQHFILYIVVGFIWLSFVPPGPPGEDITIREDAPQRYEFAAMLCFLLFAHNLLERIEGAGGQRMWVWLGTGQWQLLLLLGLLSLLFQLFFWSEVVQVNHRCTRRS